MVLLTNTSYITIDSWVDGYMPPSWDSNNNLLASSIMFENGVTTMNFTRKRDTGDSVKDHAFSDTDCYYFVYPFSGGSFDASAKTISRHSNTPVISDDKICISKCSMQPEVKKGKLHLSHTLKYFTLERFSLHFTI